MYLIKRGPRPEWHKAPFHPIIICNNRRVAEWEMGDTGQRSWMWVRFSTKMDGAGFLLVRWNGFDIDYGCVVHDVGSMPDQTTSGFVYPHTKKEPWNLIAGAIWWDNKRMPSDLSKMGVVYPTDRFTQQHILDFIMDDGCSGFGRKVPAFWPEVGDI